MDNYLVAKVTAERKEQLVSSLPVARSLLPEWYSIRLDTSLDFDGHSVVVLYLRNAHNPLRPLYFEDDELIWVFSGYTAQDLTEPESVRPLFPSAEADARPVRVSPGGIYSYVTIRKADGQLSAGQSQPSLEPVYYATSDRNLYLSNRALLAHLAARNFAPPEVEQEYFFEAISTMVAINNRTPFPDCRRIPAATQIVTSSDGEFFRIDSVDPPHFGNHALGTFQQRVQAYVDCLDFAGQIFDRVEPPELRISGGKDCRLLAAFFKARDLDVVPINHNQPWEIEGQVADRVARVLGHDACVRPRFETMFEQERFVESSCHTIFHQSGLPLAASSTYPLRTAGEKIGRPLVLGHAHYQRGGLRGGPFMRTPEGRLRVVTDRLVSPFLKEPFSGEAFLTARRFVARKSKEVLYQESLAMSAYHEFAMNYQFSPYHSYVSNWNPHVLPLLDERFCLYCLELSETRPTKGEHEYSGIVDLRNDRIAMAATKALAPELLDFPLANDRYRIERSRPFFGTEGEGFDKRDPSTLEELEHSDGTIGVNLMRNTPVPMRERMWELFNHYEMVDLLREVAIPETYTYISNPASRAPKSLSYMHLNQFLWTAFGLTLILNVDWWSESPTIP